jgi:response regulator RpfG family c-di-GMP phosphodiesterase
VIAAASHAMDRRIGDFLLKEGLLKPEQFEAVVQHVQRTGDRIEEAVLELGFVSEADLLKALAAHHRTRFVTTEKLAKAEIQRPTLQMVPRNIAEAVGVLPVMFDAATRVLSVVTADPDNLEVLREVQLVSGAKEVSAFIARPAAVKAGIAKAYGGDIHAFALLDRAAHAQFHAMLDVYQRNVLSDSSMAGALAAERPGKSRERVMSEKEMTAASNASTSGAGVSADAFVELLNVMTSLLENGRQELRGHSAQVARFARRLGERINLDPAEVAAIVVAAYVHDLGKHGAYHLTALNCSEYDGHKSAAQKTYGTPGRLLEAVRLSPETLSAAEHMYERYDGKGFPDGLSGKDIPLGARVLSLVDTYADLVQNPRNPYRKALSPAEACEALAKHRETVFDPHLLDLFRTVVLGEDLRARLLANRYHALLVDADPEETTVLELRLIEQGFEVKTARSVDQALKMLAETETDLVVGEVEIPGGDGLALLAEARKHPWGKDLPWVILTRKHARAVAQRAFELGVVDFVAKPAPTDVLVAKIKALMEQRNTQRGRSGVSGSLREMSLPDLVQVLWHGRKSGNLRINAGGDPGEIHFIEGAVVNALFKQLRGEEAFYAMLRLSDGDFGLDPSFKAPARVINESAEALLLEGMRRLDEEGAT